MLDYIIRRLLLLPLTLFCIVLINFVIINLAPGEPTSMTDISKGEASRSEDQVETADDNRYLQFREHYGLTLPIVFNSWPWISFEETEQNVTKLVTHKERPSDTEEMSVKKYNKLRIGMGDRAQFIMPHLLTIATNTTQPLETRIMAVKLMIRGGTRQAFLGGDLTARQRQYNRKTARDNYFLQSTRITKYNSPEVIEEKISKLETWYKANEKYYNFVPSFGEKVHMFFFKTRFFRYFGKVCMLDFGTIRNDDNKKVTDEVTKRFKYSLTLSLVPMLITFVLCQCFGLLMAINHNKWQDITLNIIFLALYATPIFVVAPFLIEKVALHHTFPFTDIPIPFSGFHSPENIYNNETSWQRLWDTIRHIVLPITAIMYGSMAAQSRLSRTAILEVLRCDYVRTARAKGLSFLTIMWRYIGRNASITIITSLAGSLGIILGGSLIVETVFEINGFGRFFYEAILNRDYNVIMFSALAGSFLTLLGYLVADIAYTLLDPRLTLE